MRQRFVSERKLTSQSWLFETFLSMQPAIPPFSYHLSSRYGKMLLSGVNPSGDTQKLCLENIVKLYLKVRSFSYARDRIKEKQNKMKGLRKLDLKQSSDK